MRVDQPSACVVQLLAAISKLQRGAAATAADKVDVDLLARQLESLQNTTCALDDARINGKWELLYTTSDFILGVNRPGFLRPSGPIFQYIGGMFIACSISHLRP
jgi:PAP_fibrillin